MRTERYLERAWHDENLKITEWGLSCMRVYIFVGFILGLLIGSFISVLIYEILG